MVRFRDACFRQATGSSLSVVSKSISKLSNTTGDVGIEVSRSESRRGASNERRRCGKSNIAALKAKLTFIIGCFNVRRRSVLPDLAGPTTSTNR